MTDATTLPEIVFYALQPWENEYPSPSLGLARALAVHTRVWYVSRPPTWRDVVKGTTKRSRPPGVYEEEGEGGSKLYVVELRATAPINALPSESGLFDGIRARVDRGMNRELGRILSENEVGDYLWINMYSPTQFLEVSLHRPPLARYYYTIDAIEENWYTSRHGLRYEALQASHSDAVFGTSSKLGETMASFRDASGAACAKTVHVLPNAMAADIYFADPDAPEPADIRDLPHPRVGFVGNFDATRIDYAGIEVLAKARPDVQFVFVGPWNASEQYRAAFEALPNVHLLGRRDQRECPPYLRHVDICIIPFAINALTASIYPLKINEYLAIGKPVLATPFSKDIQDFRDNIHLAPIDQWAGMIEEVIDGHTESRRKASVERAADNTWESRAREFLRLVGYPVVAPALANEVAA